MSTEFTLGERLAIYRKSLGLSQKQLADLIGISQGYVGDVEADRSGPSTKFITLMLQKTNVSSDWLLTGEGPMERAAASEGEAPKAESKQGSVLRLPPPGAAGLPQARELVERLRANIRARLDAIEDVARLHRVEAELEDVMDRQELERRLAELEQRVGDPRSSS